MHWADLETKEEETRRYENAKPFKHIQIQHFLDEEAFLALREALQEEEFEQKENDLFSLAQTCDLRDSNNPVLASFVAFMNSQKTRRWVQETTGVETTPGNMSIAGTIYQQDDYLLCHDDQLEGRKIAWILYLTTLDKEEGGGLALYTTRDGEPDVIAQTYQPEENTLFLFEVHEKSWHEVEQVRAETYRVSIGGWLE